MQLRAPRNRAKRWGSGQSSLLVRSTLTLKLRYFVGETTKFLGHQTLMNPEGQGGLETWQLSDPQGQAGQLITPFGEKSGYGGTRDGKQSAPLVNLKWEKSPNSVKAERSSCHTDHGAHKAESRYYLFLHRNTSLRVPPPALQEPRVSSSLTPAPN